MTAKIIVKGIILDREHKRILLVQRSSDDPTGAGTWENAGGNVEPGESLEEALKREIREETGLDVKILRTAYAALVDFGEAAHITVYLCEAAGGDVTLSGEHSGYVWADGEACRSLLPEAIIRDFEVNGIFDIMTGD